MIRETMAVRSRGVKKEYADEMNLQGVATQQEMEDAFSEHIDTEHTAEGLLPTPVEDNQILKSYDDNGTLKWKIVAADDPVEGLTVISLPYYWDDVRGKYLANQSIKINFYENGTGKRRRYMNYIPEIRSNRVPFKVQNNEEYCLVSAEYYTTDENSGSVMEIRDISDGVDTLATVDLGSNATDYFYIDTLNIDIKSGVWLAGRILSTSLDNPVLVLELRKVYTPA